LWLDLQLRPARPERFNIATCTRITGVLDQDLFRRALERVIRRHSALRARFAPNEQGEPRQRIAADMPGCYEFQDCVDLAHAEQCVEDDLPVPFESLAQPLCRFKLYRLPGDEWLWYAKYHHLIIDGQGLALLRQDLCATYTALLQGAEPAGQAADEYDTYLREDADYRSSCAYAADRDFWTGLHADEPEQPWPQHNRSVSELNRLTARSNDLPPRFCDWASRRAQELSAEPSDLLIAAVALFLSCISGERTIGIGLPTHGRPKEYPQLIAFCSNVLPLRLTVDPQWTLRQLVDSVGAQVRTALRHRRYRYEDLKQALGSAATERNLLPAVVNIMRFPRAMEFQIGPSRARLSIRAAGPIHGLSFLFYGRRETSDLSVAIDASSGWVQPEGLQALRTSFATFVERLAGTATESVVPRDVVDTTARRQLDRWGRGPHLRLRRGTFIELFREAAARSPDRTALRWNAGSLSYRALDRLSDYVATALRNSVAPRSVVAVYMQRGPEAILAFLGILKAGGIYLPIDTENPPTRVQRMLAGASAARVLTETHRLDRAAQALPGALLSGISVAESAIAYGATASIEVAPCDIAYIIHTSGSTGRPKGAINKHSALANLVLAQAQAFGVGTESRVIQLARPGFDASVSEIGMALGSGASLYIAPADLAEVAADLPEILRRERITTATVPPALLALLPCSDLPDLQTLIVAGEACPLDLARRWAKGRRFINAYGPTETCVCATWGEFSPQSPVLSIGKPLANVRVHIVNARGETLPPGFPGELCIGGAGVGLGYLNDAALTAARFIRDPTGDDPDTICYRSGDLARWLPDGALEFLGRIDTQAKVRGFRIEPAEIEAALRAHPSVTGSAAIVRSRNGRAVIDAYAACADACSPEALRGHLRSMLPDFMVPATISILQDLPLSLNGKLDRGALPEPPLDPPPEPAGLPSTPTQARVAQILEDALQVRIGPHDNFFNLGGDSLLAIQAIMEIRRAFAVEFPADRFFLHSNVVSIAGYLDAAVATGDTHAVDSPWRQFFK
jgi:amino acid adenylation domain-containing protein